MTEKRKDGLEGRPTKQKKKNIWEEVISDVANATMTPDSHLILLGNVRRLSSL